MSPSGFHVQIAGRFIGQDNFRFVQYGPGDDDTLLFSTGKFVRHFVPLVFHANLLEHFFNSPFYFGTVFPAGSLKHEFQVFVHGTVG